MMPKRDRKKGRNLLVLTIIVLAVGALGAFGAFQQSIFTGSASSVYFDASYANGVLKFSSSELDELRPGSHALRGFIEGERHRGVGPHDAFTRAEGAASQFYAFIESLPVSRASDARPNDWQSFYAIQSQGKLQCEISGFIQAMATARDPNCLECTASSDLYVRKQITPVPFKVIGTVGTETVGTVKQLVCVFPEAEYRSLISAIPNVSEPVFASGKVEFKKAAQVSYTPISQPSTSLPSSQPSQPAVQQPASNGSSSPASTSPSQGPGSGASGNDPFLIILAIVAGGLVITAVVLSVRKWRK